MTLEHSDTLIKSHKMPVVQQIADTIRIMGAIVKETLTHPRGTSTIKKYDNPTRDIEVTRTTNSPKL